MEDRTTIAAMALQGMLANSDLFSAISMDVINENKGASEKYIGETMTNFFALCATSYADALIADLNKK